jgi:hypothetical protein
VPKKNESEVVSTSVVAEKTMDSDSDSDSDWAKRLVQNESRKIAIVT